MGESDWSKMPMIVEIPGQEVSNYRINVTQIKQVRGEWSLGDKPDRLIAGQKPSGLMRPKLRSLTEATKAKAPFYKLSLFRNKGHGLHE